MTKDDIQELLHILDFKQDGSIFLEPENLVVLHCVDRLLWKGYSPFHIELEPAWKLGHSAKGGYADVWVRTFRNGGFDGPDEDVGNYNTLSG